MAYFYVVWIWASRRGGGRRKPCTVVVPAENDELLLVFNDIGSTFELQKGVRTVEKMLYLH